ncbi:MAG: hypothetical protein ABI776_18335, partial [Nocardioidaceae bacterium]
MHLRRHLSLLGDDEGRADRDGLDETDRGRMQGAEGGQATAELLGELTADLPVGRPRREGVGHPALTDADHPSGAQPRARHWIVLAVAQEGSK